MLDLLVVLQEAQQALEWQEVIRFASEARRQILRPRLAVRFEEAILGGKSRSALYAQRLYDSDSHLISLI
jgi:hypothetical protein